MPPNPSFMLTLHGSNVQTEPFCGIRATHLDPVDFDQTGISTIARLSLGIGPYAIFAAVRLVAIQSFKSETARSFSHIFQKLQKSRAIFAVRKPSWIYRYPPSTVACKILVRRLRATFNHTSPRNPRWAIGHAMTGVAFITLLSKAAATFRVTASDIATGCNKLYAALTHITGFTASKALKMRYHCFYLTETGGWVNARL